MWLLTSLSETGQKVVTDITANDGSWTFLCSTWASLEGQWAIYVNSQLMDSGDKLSESETISGHGTLVLGQEQDSPGGHFSAAESFRGKLTQLNIWSRVLNKTEISLAMNSCFSVRGDLVAWPDFYPGIHGFIEVKDFSLNHFDSFLLMET